ncbi:MAG TPA: class E sortase [Solirubrobacteraceae bacterium]|nr:class E sortase [Solirubrobacteraceae bacterium]
MSEILFTPSSSGLDGNPAPQRGRRRRGRQRLLRMASVLLVALGVLVLLDAGVTLVWQEPLSALYAKFQQDHLKDALRKIERAQPSASERLRLERLTERRRIAYLARRLRHQAPPGSAVGGIHIPRIGANYVVVYGTGTEELEQGPGIYTSHSYPGASFPGLGGTTAIAGHRTTFLAPFRNIDELRRGDRILLDMPYAHLTYTVTGQHSVSPYDVNAAVRDVGYSRLVLSACTPPFSAAERLLVFARLTRTVPVGAALRPGPTATSGARSRPARARGRRASVAHPPAAPSLPPPPVRST